MEDHEAQEDPSVIFVGVIGCLCDHRARAESDLKIPSGSIVMVF